jgi:hypothetical protein
MQKEIEKLDQQIQNEKGEPRMIMFNIEKQHLKKHDSSVKSSKEIVFPYIYEINPSYLAQQLYYFDMIQLKKCSEITKFL